MDYTEQALLASELAHRAGQLLQDYQKGRIPLKVSRKESYITHDLVTSADHASQELIVRAIHERYPSHKIVAEEDARTLDIEDILNANQDSPHRWIIDPLDGTINFARGCREYSVSIAYEHEGEVRAGVLDFPALDKHFFALKGQRAVCNGFPLVLAPTPHLHEAVVTGCTPFINEQSTQVSQAVAGQCRVWKSFHCATYSISQILEGKADAYLHPDLHEWDLAAATLLLEEAGGKASMWNGEAWQPHEYYLASNPILHQTLLDIVQEQIRQSP